MNTYTLQELEVRFGARLDALEAGLRSAEQKTDRTAGNMERRLRKQGQTFQSIGRDLSVALTAPLAAAGLASVKLASDYEAGMARILALTDETIAGLKGAREGVDRIARDTGRGLMDLQQAYYFIASSGYQGAEALEVLESSAQGARVGLGETKTVADAVTSAVTAYGREVLSAERATDILLATIKTGKGEPDQLARSIGRVLPIAAEMGVRFEDIGAAIANMTRVGMPAEVAIDYLRGTLMALQRPQADTIQGFERIGLTVDEVRKKVANDGLIVTFQELDQRLKAAGLEMGDVVTATEALQAALVLARKDAVQMTDVTGQLDEAVKKVAGTAADEGARALSELQIAARELGQELLPMAKEGAEMARGLLAEINKLGPEGRRALMVLLGGVTLLGPAMSGLGTIMVGVASKQVAATAAVIAGGDAAVVAAGKVGVLSGAWRTLGGVIAGVGAALGGLALGEQLERHLFGNDSWYKGSDLLNEMRSTAKAQDALSQKRFQEDMAARAGTRLEQRDRLVQEIARLRTEKDRIDGGGAGAATIGREFGSGQPNPKTQRVFDLEARILEAEKLLKGVLGGLSAAEHQRDPSGVTRRLGGLFAPAQAFFSPQGTLAPGFDAGYAPARITSDMISGGGGVGGAPARKPVSRYEPMARQIAQRFGLSEEWFLSMIEAESAWNPRARSRAGAMGLGQLMPGTARGLGVRNPWDPEQNLIGAARYLKAQYDRFGTYELALAAYNAGPGRVRGGRIPQIAETQNYVRRIKGLVASGKYADGRAGAEADPILGDLLDAAQQLDEAQRRQAEEAERLLDTYRSMGLELEKRQAGYEQMTHLERLEYDLTKGVHELTQEQVDALRAAAHELDQMQRPEREAEAARQMVEQARTLTEQEEVYDRIDQKAQSLVDAGQRQYANLQGFLGSLVSLEERLTAQASLRLELKEKGALLTEAERANLEASAVAVERIARAEQLNLARSEAVRRGNDLVAEMEGELRSALGQPEPDTDWIRWASDQLAGIQRATGQSATEEATRQVMELAEALMDARAAAEKMREVDFLMEPILGEAEARKQELTGYANAFTDAFMQGIDRVKHEGLAGLWGAMVQGLERTLAEMAAEYLRSQLIQLLMNAFGLGVGAGTQGMEAPVAGVTTEPSGPRPFASGGRVMRRVPVLVGERGAEVFVPDDPGRVLPEPGRGTAERGQVVNVTLNVGAGADESFWRTNRRRIAGDLGREVSRAMR